MIYLDYNATTPLDPAAAEAMLPFLHQHHGNPSSNHPPGRFVRQAVERARQQLASPLGTSPSEIVFTAGGSEANNHAIKGVAFAEGKGHIIISAVEHPSVAVPARWLAERGFELTVVEVDSTGMVDPADVQQAIRPDTILISIMLANNEVGTIQPIAQIARIARSAEVLMHTDAAQAVGKIRTAVNDLGVDLLTVAGHKLHAPPGVGALYVRAEVELESLVHGAGHEQGRRAGTEAVPAIVGLGAAAEAFGPHLHDEKIRTLRDRFHAGLIDALGDGVVLNGHPKRRLPNTLNLSFPGHVGVELLAELENICASPGAACHSDRPEPSAVLQAMGVDNELALSAIRFSFGRFNTEEEIDQAIGEVVRAVNA